jgi:hypothetical protein
MERIILFVFVTGSLLCACQHQFGPFRERPIDGLAKQGSEIGVGASRPISTGEKRPQIYVRQPSLSVSEDLSSESGSLFNPDDKRNFLVVPKDPLADGSYVDIGVVYSRAESTEAAASPSPSPSPISQEGMSEEEKRILASLPSLEPADAKKVPLRTFKMQVVGRKPNGDYHLRYQSEHTTQEGSYGLLINAVLPHEKAIAPEPKRTSDLSDVEWVESKDGNITERRTPGWEDEYSFRMSGFSELKSKEALALEEKKTQLEQSRKLIEQQLRQIGAERNNVAKTRAEVAKDKAETDEKVSSLKSEIESKDKTIAEQRDEIESLRGEEKPGAQKDASGKK